MSESLIRNNESSGKLYRYSGSLLRTPIAKTLTLVPDEMAYYDVAGSYNSSMPTAGCVDTTGQNIYSRAVLSGKMMRRYYTGNGTPSTQIWRRVTTSHEPEFVFYQGSFSPSASSMAIGMNYGEAFMKIPAYHFSIPTKWSSFQVASAALTLTIGGDIHSYAFPTTELEVSSRDNYGMPYYARLAPTSRLASNDPWRGNWSQKLGVFANLNYSPGQMHNNALQDVNVDTSGSLAGKVDDLYSYDSRYRTYSKVIGLRKIWDNTYVSYYDGNIPVSPSPWQQSIILNAAAVNQVATLRGGWITLTPDVAVSSRDYDNTSTDYPFYYPASDSGYAWWMCSSYWGFKLQVTVVLGG